MVQANRQGAIDKLNGIIGEGRGRTMNALAEIKAEFDSREDLIVRPAHVDFEVEGNEVRPVILRAEDRIRRTDDVAYQLTGHSYGQLLDRVKIPKAYADDLIAKKQQALLRRNLMERFPVISPEGVMVRHVGDKIKGILSTAYKPMDAAPVFEGFAGEALQRGFVPYRGLNTDMRMALSFIWPQVYEPKAGEFVVYGVQQMTGDYGGVANCLALMVLRIWCDNLGVGMDLFRKIHIGKRFGDENGEGVIEMSRRTLELDTRTVVSATRDAVKAAFEYFEPLNNAITAAADREPNLAATMAALTKKGLKKDVVEQAKKMYEMDMPIEALPQGNSAWRLSNVLSLLAKSAAGDDRVVLEGAAFDVLGIPEKLVA
jgi:hypothetical protein